MIGIRLAADIAEPRFLTAKRSPVMAGFKQMGAIVAPVKGPQDYQHIEAGTEACTQGEDEEKKAEEVVHMHSSKTLRQRADVERREDLAKVGSSDVEDQKEGIVALELLGNRSAGGSAYD
jgi:hypothetical protein